MKFSPRLNWGMLRRSSSGAVWVAGSRSSSIVAGSAVSRYQSNGSLVGRDHHALDVEMVVEAFGAAFASDAAVAYAAPGGRRVEPVMIVDPDDAGP